MKGYFSVVVIIIVFVIISVSLYFLLLSFQRYQGASYAVGSLTEVESHFEYFDTYIPKAKTGIQPVIQLEDDGSLTYKSSLTPCITLIADRTWEIYSRKNNLFPGFVSKMFYDHFWRVSWLGLSERSTNTTQAYVFYGPFRYVDQPKRNFLEYVLIGKDVVQDGSKIEILSQKDDCYNDQFIQVTE